MGWAYLDIPRVEQYVPPNVAVVNGWQHDFVKFMRYSQNPHIHYYFLLDWPGALVGPRAFVLDYHLMKAYRDAGYYPGKIQDSQDFLCSHTDFVVLDSPNAVKPQGVTNRSADVLKPNWFDSNIKRQPEFDWKVLASFDASEVTRQLIAVHRKAPLNFCNQP